MDIVLHMLNGYLLASKAYLHCHLKETADFDRQSQIITNQGVPGQPDTPEVTREELKNALLAAQVSETCAKTPTLSLNTVKSRLFSCVFCSKCANMSFANMIFPHALTCVCLQDSAAVQILLEVCLPTSEEQQLGANKESLLTSIGAPRPVRSKQGGPEPPGGRTVEDAETEGGLLSDLREVQCLICCLLHQMFIADPNIAKLVHFQVGQRGRLSTEGLNCGSTSASSLVIIRGLFSPSPCVSLRVTLKPCFL